MRFSVYIRRQGCFFLIFNSLMRTTNQQGARREFHQVVAARRSKKKSYKQTKNNHTVSLPFHLAPSNLNVYCVCSVPHTHTYGFVVTSSSFFPRRFFCAQHKGSQSKSAQRRKAGSTAAHHISDFGVNTTQRNAASGHNNGAIPAGTVAPAPRVHQQA